MEEACSLKQLMASLKLDYRKTAEFIGKSKSYVSERIQLLDLPDDLKEPVSNGTLPLKKALELKKITNPQKRARIFAKSSSGDLEQLRILVESVLEKTCKPHKKREKWDTLQDIRDFSRKTKGVRFYKDRISVQFKTPDDLRNLLIQMLALLGNQEEVHFES